MTALESMLREWGECTARALEDMIKDIRAGKLDLGTMERDFAFIRSQLGRLAVLQNDVMRHNGSRPYRAGPTGGSRE